MEESRRGIPVLRGQRWRGKCSLGQGSSWHKEISAGQATCGSKAQKENRCIENTEWALGDTMGKSSHAQQVLANHNMYQIVNPKGEMKGSAITGPVGKEAAELWPVRARLFFNRIFANNFLAYCKQFWCCDVKRID